MQDYSTCQKTLFPCLKRDNEKQEKKKKMVNFYEGATDVRYWQLRSKSLIKTVLSLIKQLYKCIAPEMLYWTVRILDADLEALAPLLKYSSKILEDIPSRSLVFYIIVMRTKFLNCIRAQSKMTQDLILIDLDESAIEPSTKAQMLTNTDV